MADTFDTDSLGAKDTGKGKALKTGSLRRSYGNKKKKKKINFRKGNSNYKQGV
jgi:hypothetical protein